MSLRPFGVKKDEMDHLSSKHFSNEVDFLAQYLARHLKLGHLFVNEIVSQI